MRDERIKRVRAYMEEKGLEGLFVSSMDNIRYLSGFTGSAGYIVITLKEAYFFTDSRYTLQAGAEVSGFRIEEVKRPWVDIPGFLKDLGLKRMGFEGAYLSFDSYHKMREALPGSELVSLGDELDGMRAIKDDHEIEAIERAAGIACSAIMDVLPLIKEGVSERDLALELEYRIRKEGGEGVSFDPIVLSGRRTALPHGKPSSNTIGSREPVLIDFGAVFDGYHSDETWTFAIDGFDREMERIYMVVKEAHDSALEAVRPGVEAKTIDGAARGVIERAGYGPFFGHGTGHGVGLSVHERPKISPYSTEVIREGMVFTIEPAIYIPDRGGVRIEDMVLVTNRGCRVLTRVSKDGAIVC